MDGPWWALVASTLTTAVVVGIAKAQPYLTGERAKRDAEEAKLEEAKARLDARTLKYVEGVEARAEKDGQLRSAEIAGLRAALLEKDVEINRLLALVRRWYDLAHDMRHEGARLLQRCLRAMEGQVPPPPGTRMPLLSYDPDHPDAPSGIGSSPD